MENLEALQTLIDSDVANEELIETILDKIIEQSDDDEEKKTAALVAYLRGNGNKVSPDDVTEHYGNFKVGRCEYKVLTEDEADEEVDNALDSYIDDCLELPDAMRGYFDEARWKKDALMDGRAAWIGTYDGHESEYADYYIYRVS